jgi:hypothetical protein
MAVNIGPPAKRPGPKIIQCAKMLVIEFVKQVLGFGLALPLLESSVAW